MDDYRIQPAESRHLAALPAIEREAASIFPPALLSPEVLAYTTPPEEFVEACKDGNLWVALTGDDEPVGFALVDEIEDHAHLEELDVLPTHGQRGLGRRLVERVLEEARARGTTPVTLSTFRDIPWNAPFYSRLGFRSMTAAELTPALRELVLEERRHGLDPDERVVMIACEPRS